LLSFHCSLIEAITILFLNRLLLICDTQIRQNGNQRLILLDIELQSLSECINMFMTKDSDEANPFGLFGGGSGN
jgi:hypothetical protein